MSIFKRLLGDNPPNLRRRTSDIDTDVDTNLGDDDNKGGDFLDDFFNAGNDSDSSDSNDSDSNDSDSGNDD